MPANATDEQMVSGIANRMGPALLALNKCPDFEVNRGHYFGTGMVAGEPALSDNDKRALIEFLKTFYARMQRWTTATTSIVGSGAGGGTLAARLAEAGMRVVVLEAGGDPRATAPRLPEDYDVPAFHPLRLGKSGAALGLLRAALRRTRHASVAIRKLQPRGIYYPRAGTLGGCTAHNAMILMAPHDSDWDDIAALTGDASWRATEMRRYFQRLEQCRYRPAWRTLSRLGLDRTGHGWDGWLPHRVRDAVAGAR